MAKCVKKRHRWCRPHSVVGGLPENPGVRGNGPGVITLEVCRYCGQYRHTDTAAQDPFGRRRTRVTYLSPDDISMSWVRSLA